MAALAQQAQVSLPAHGGSLENLARAVSAPTPQPDFHRLITDVLQGRISFCFHYQPIVDLQRGCVAGYEALVRFGTDVPLSPDRWMAAAEQYNLRLALEDVVTSRALHARGHVPRNCFLSVNVSPSYVLSDLWDQLLTSFPTLGGVVIEITENEPVDHYGPLLAKLAEIRRRGGYVAVDDAGSGYASLNHVMQMKPEFVKLDRIFVSECDLDRAKGALIEMVGKAAGRLDAWIIAEGVETSAELDELIRLNVPLAQGYYLSRPAQDMTQLAAEKSAAILGRMQAQAAGRTVAASTEFCTVCASEQTATDLLAEQPRLDFAVVTDQWGRPQQVVERHPLIGLRTISGAMKVLSSSRATDVLERALTRPPATRFDPLLATNERGEMAGVIRLDRLMRQCLQTGE